MGVTDADNGALPEENKDSEVGARCIVPKVNKRQNHKNCSGVIDG